MGKKPQNIKKKKTCLFAAVSGPSPARPDRERPRTQLANTSPLQPFPLEEQTLFSSLPTLLITPVSSAPGCLTTTAAAAQAPVSHHLSLQHLLAFLPSVLLNQDLLRGPARVLCGSSASPVAKLGHVLARMPMSFASKSPVTGPVTSLVSCNGSNDRTSSFPALLWWICTFPSISFHERSRL